MSGLQCPAIFKGSKKKLTQELMDSC